MKIRQLRYFTRVVELGSMGKAAQDLGVVTSALSQQISRLESELSTRLLQRTSTGVVPTDAGIAFFRQAQLALRHIDAAGRAARQARLSGQVSVGMAPTTASVMALPLIEAMRTHMHGLRTLLAQACHQVNVEPNVVLEIDSLAILMDAVRAGFAATIQPGAGLATRVVMRDVALERVRRGLWLGAEPII